MGVYTRPSIVTNGLVLNLDAANIKSYPGSGTTWTDLSGNLNSGSLVNSPTFVKDGGGSIALNGTSQYATISNLPAFGDTSPITVSCWINATNVSNTYGVIATIKGVTYTWQLSYSGDVTYNLYLSQTGTSNGAATTTLPAVGNFYNIVATYNGGDRTLLTNYKIYVSGVEHSLKTLPVTGAPTNATVIGFRLGGISSNYFTGRVSQFSVYNRALTSSEVQQNYNALKSRFNLS